MSNTEGFLEEEAFELAFRGDMESREERLFDRIGCGRRRHRPPWGGQPGEDRWERDGRSGQGQPSGSGQACEVQEKEPRETLLRVKGLQGEEAGSDFKFSVRSLLVLEGS